MYLTTKDTGKLTLNWARLYIDYQYAIFGHFRLAYVWYI